MLAGASLRHLLFTTDLSRGRTRGPLWEVQPLSLHCLQRGKPPVPRTLLRSGIC